MLLLRLTIYSSKVCLAEGIESKKDAERMLLKQQLCNVTGMAFGQDYVYLTRKSDGQNLGGFKAADLAAAAGGGTLLHLALEPKLPISICRLILEKDPSAAAVADGAGRLPLQVAIESGAAPEVLALLQ